MKLLKPFAVIHAGTVDAVVVRRGCAPIGDASTAEVRREHDDRDDR